MRTFKETLQDKTGKKHRVEIDVFTSPNAVLGDPTFDAVAGCPVGDCEHVGSTKGAKTIGRARSIARQEMKYHFKKAGH